MSHRQNFVRLIQSMSRHYDTWRVFSDFVEMAALTISNSDRHFLSTPKKVWEEREKAYLEIINRYRKIEQPVFAKMLAELVMELDDCVASGHFTDVLGEVFHELELHNKWNGQFFTPQHICDMMGRMVFNKDITQEAIDSRGYVNISEPCSGAGAMIYGFVNAFCEAGFNHSKQTLVVANDIDIRCVYMTYVQCSLYGIPAVVIHKNTLSGEVFGYPWYSPIYTLYLWRWKREDTETLTIASGKERVV